MKPVPCTAGGNVPPPPAACRTAAMRRDFMASNGCVAVAVAMETCVKTLELQQHAVFLFLILAQADGQPLLQAAMGVLQQVRTAVKQAMVIHRYDTNIQGYGYHLLRALSAKLPDEEEEKA